MESSDQLLLSGQPCLRVSARDRAFHETARTRLRFSTRFRRGRASEKVKRIRN